MKGDERMRSFDRCIDLSTAVALVCILSITANLGNGQPNVNYTKQGFSMRLCFDNRSTMGRLSYPGGSGFNNLDSVGLEYPVGYPPSRGYEHIIGAALWVGGKLDTSQIGTSSPIKLVTTGYEGWRGPFCEFYPGSSPADSIWKVSGRGVPHPPGWNTYWGDLIPPVSISDNDHYCLYDDTQVGVAGHIPLRLKVAQNSFVWNSPFAEAIHIIEYRIVNVGVKRIDSAYVGVFMESLVGLYSPVPYYVLNNYSDYDVSNRIGFVHASSLNLLATPVGVALLHSSRPPDSLQYTFVSYTGPSSPRNDLARYDLLSSGRISPTPSPAEDILSVYGCGPFTIRPGTDANPDTLRVVFGILSGQNVNVMLANVGRARNIYLNGGQVAVERGDEETPLRFELFQNYPNPFNPSTTIRFTLSHSGFARLTVYDILGREIATLLAAELPAGVHTVRWDASNHPSGIYFYRLESGSFVETQRLILLR
jgi:hypothetical protein